jgi:hypothetical protein
MKTKKEPETSSWNGGEGRERTERTQTTETMMILRPTIMPARTDHTMQKQILMRRMRISKVKTRTKTKLEVK